MKHAHQLELTVQPQKDDTTCGPTCLEAVYRYYGYDTSLDRLAAEVVTLPGGGTMAVWLACHALQHGFDADIYTYNLHIFDPTWFQGETDLAERLVEQSNFKRDASLSHATEGYLEFLRLGGQLRFQELNGQLIRRILNREQPILTGLSATYLYNCAREHRNQYDDVRGEPAGHFVVLRGYDKAARAVSVADPLLDNPRYGAHYYTVKIDRLVGAILLGILTHDANLIVIAPRERSTAPARGRSTRNPET